MCVASCAVCMHVQLHRVLVSCAEGWWQCCHAPLEV